MIIKGFKEYLKESIGANIAKEKQSDILNQPDVIVPIPNIIHSRRGSSIPRQWGNSPYMSGGTSGDYGSNAMMLGSNPKQKKRVLTYHEFMKTSNDFSNRNEVNEDESNEFSWDDYTEETKPADKWESLERDMIEIVDKYSGDFGVDSYGVVDAMYQVMDEMFQKIKRK